MIPQNIDPEKNFSLKLRRTFFTCSHSSDPEKEGALKSENSNSLIIKRSSNGAGNVTRCNGNKSRREKACSSVPKLFGQEICGNGSKAGKDRGGENANVLNVSREAESVENVVNAA